MLVVGSEATDNRLGRCLWGESSGEVVLDSICDSVEGGLDKEFVGESSAGSVRESLFIFLRERDFVEGGRKGNWSASDTAEEAAEVEAELGSPRARAICGGSTWESRRRAAGGPFLRGIGVVDWAIIENCGVV